MALDYHCILVKFPRDPDATFSIVEEASPDVVSRFPSAAGRRLSVLKVHLKDGANVTVGGFGTPFANHGDDSAEVDGWVNENQAIVDGLTLLDVLRQRAFTFVVAYSNQQLESQWNSELPPPVDYPYGHNHNWGEASAMALSPALRAKEQFKAAYAYESLNAYVAVLTQAIAQDVMWLDKAAAQIEAMFFRAYFVSLDETPADKGTRFYVVMPLTKEFRESIESPWRRLKKNLPFSLSLRANKSNKYPAFWHVLRSICPYLLTNSFARKCIILDHPGGIDRLAAHHNDKYDLVLEVRRPASGEYSTFVPQVFESRSAADAALEEGDDNWNLASLAFDANLADHERKVDAVNRIHPTRKSTNPMPVPYIQSGADHISLQDRRTLHRSLLLGHGFFEWMTQTTTVPRQLPIVNFLDVEDTKYTDALLGEALPQDRARFRQYLSKRPLGLGLMTAVCFTLVFSGDYLVLTLFLRDLGLVKPRLCPWPPWLCRQASVQSLLPPRPTSPSTTLLSVSTA